MKTIWKIIQEDGDGYETTDWIEIISDQAPKAELYYGESATEIIVDGVKIVFDRAVYFEKEVAEDEVLFDGHCARKMLEALRLVESAVDYIRPSERRDIKKIADEFEAKMSSILERYLQAQEG